jgi:hypothetical protein
MKSKQVFKSFTALSFDGNGVAGAEALAPSGSQPRLMPKAGPEAVTQFDDFRAMLRERYTAPYALSSRYRYWGINE